MSPGACVTVIGAGLAGAEAAWQLATRSLRVRLVEMRPARHTPAHHGGSFAELVCSNSLKSDDPDTAAGLLKRELEDLGSLVMASARLHRVPAGAALAVDRERFARGVTEAVESHPFVEVDRREAESLPETEATIVATGPLTSPAMESALSGLIGPARLSFFDAAAPIVDAASVDRRVAFAASRYGKGAGDDYLNLPLSREEYEAFIGELLAARRVRAKEFEPAELFQACQPIEEVARKGADAPRFGAMKPVGLVDPRTGARPWAAVQLRAENRGRTAYNLVGFQTNLTFAEQRRVFRTLPGLARAEFLRYGVMHRNTFVDAPRLLDPSLELRGHPGIWFAGQLVGTEGYLEAAGTGLLAAVNVHAALAGRPPIVLPPETVLGALVRYATDPDTVDYQPMHANFGLLPPLDPPVKGKRARCAAYAERARLAMATCIAESADMLPGGPR
ncbi:MAG: methylenetetrahydrofolate--tRNA-(uracil(54)-C(5))-methyltransferase (FADH(2)-oxidizing) TrmFO [Coriobacteriia bacterium]|nr:methylenetetrahydrofolate--tRNA-(uracil(54)-C(5))-methyltransferase (FADH(2)-oxidizing) TrmFO [Coriobacteriia bacterium]